VAVGAAKWTGVEPDEQTIGHRRRDICLSSAGKSGDGWS